MRCQRPKHCEKRSLGLEGIVSCLVCRLATDRREVGERLALLSHQRQEALSAGEKRLQRFKESVLADQRRVNRRV